MHEPPPYRRALLTVAAVAALWALVVTLTGGVSIELGPLNISSRNPRNPALAAGVLVAVLWAIAPRGTRIAAARADGRWIASNAGRLARGLLATWLRVERIPRRVAPVAVLLLAGLVAIGGYVWCARVAAASDAWGYLSQARLWAAGTLRVHQPLMRELADLMPREGVAPLAYRPSPQGTPTIVPVTAPGLPMLMAAFSRAGGEEAVFVVVPLLAAAAIWATYALGTSLGGPLAGVVAALLLALSPSFLFQLTAAPMSDIPAMAWWAVSLAALPTRSWRSALLSGAAAGAAILTRPNLVPLAALPGLFLLVDCIAEGRLTGTAARRLVAFVVPIVACCAGIAVLFDRLYGSPFDSGYGGLDELYALANLPANLRHYPVWLVESQTWIVIAALAGPVVAPRRAFAVLLLAFVPAVAACYVFYTPFDAWWSLRFLLPAYPPLLALAAAAVVAVAGRLPRPVRALAFVAVIAAVLTHEYAFARSHSALDSSGEWKYAITGRHVAATVPRNAVLISEQHSGSLRYYTGLTTIRFVWIPNDRLDAVVERIRREGYRPYVVVEDWEEDDLRRRFGGSDTIATLAGWLVSELPLGHARVYDLGGPVQRAR